MPFTPKRLGCSVADLVLENAKVLTMDPQRPLAYYVAVKGDHISSVGSQDELTGLTSAGAKRINCQGMTLVPGFNDAHIHLLAYASSFPSADRLPPRFRSRASPVSCMP